MVGQYYSVQEYLGQQYLTLQQNYSHQGAHISHISRSRYGLTLSAAHKLLFGHRGLLTVNEFQTPNR